MNRFALLHPLRWSLEVAVAWGRARLANTVRTDLDPPGPGGGGCLAVGVCVFPECPGPCTLGTNQIAPGNVTVHLCPPSISAPGLTPAAAKAIADANLNAIVTTPQPGMPPRPLRGPDA